MDGLDNKAQETKVIYVVIYTKYSLKQFSAGVATPVVSSLVHDTM